MIVCICKNISSKQLKECLHLGMTTEDICYELGLGTECGSCLDYARNIVEDYSALSVQDCSAA